MINAMIGDIMTEHVVTVVSDATVADTAHLLMRLRINGILVVEPDNKDNIIGIFTTSDLLKLIDQAFDDGPDLEAALEATGRALISDYVTPNVVCVDRNASVRDVIELMHAKNIHTIPVVEGGKLVGIVGRHDMLNLAFAD